MASKWRVGRRFGGCGAGVFRILTDRSQIRGSGFGLFGLEGGSRLDFGLRGSQGMAPRHEFFEGAVVGPLAGIDDALEALEDGRGGREGVEEPNPNTRRLLTFESALLMSAIISLVVGPVRSKK